MFGVCEWHEMMWVLDSALHHVTSGVVQMAGGKTIKTRRRSVFDYNYKGLDNSARMPHASRTVSLRSTANGSGRQYGQ